MSGATQETASTAKLVTLLLLCLSQFMLVMDVAIVNVALPSIQHDLGFSAENLGLVITAYALTFGGLLLLGGRAADLAGHRRIFLLGLVVFTLASLASGAAQSDVMLVVARAAQGVGAAFMAPAALALLTIIFAAGPERSRALGVWSALAAGGGAAGLILGGVLTNLASWRWIFLINVPVGAVVFLLALRLLPASRPTTTRRLDGWGAITATLGLIALTLGVGRISQTGLANGGTLLLLGGAVVLLAAFVALERRVAEPLVDFRLFRSRTLTGANLAVILMSAIILGLNYFLTLYFQDVLRYSPLQTGLAFLPVTLISGVASLLSARLVGRVRPRTLLIIGMLALGLGPLLIAPLGLQSSYAWQVLPGLAVFAVGLGIGYTVGILIATGGVAPDQQGAVSGIVTTSQQLGGALGLATLTTIASIAASVAGSVAQAAFLAGFRAAGIAMAVCGALGAVVVALLVRQPVVASPAELPPVAGTCHTAACQPGLVDATIFLMLAVPLGLLP